MADITPELYRAIENDFTQAYNESHKIKNLLKKLETGTATYAEANAYAIECGNLLSKTFKKKLSSSVLPDGRMYYNIAEAILNRTLGKNYKLVSDYATVVQNELNKAFELGLKAIVPGINQDRIDGIINRISSELNFDDIAWILDDPIINFTQSIIDEFIKANADFDNSVGLRPVLIRTLSGNCCNWCRNLAGIYDYNEAPREIYQKHENCRCTVTYYPKKSNRRQNVHSKIWS